MNPLALVLLVPPVSALACLACRKRVFGRRFFGVGGMVLLLAASLWLVSDVSADGIRVLAAGNWRAPFGIVMVADLAASIMVLVSAIIGLAVAVYSLAEIGGDRERHGYFAFLHFMVFGVCGAFLTGDIFNMFVWFEVMLVSSFALLALGGERPQLEGAVKYVVLNLISSSFFLVACGLLYAKLGSLNLADLAVRVRSADDPEMLGVTAVLFLVAFGIKAGLFPLYFWLPASYHTPPVAVSAIFAGLLTKVGVYALIRVFTLVFSPLAGGFQGLLLALAGLTMIAGVFGAVAQYDYRRLLSFHIVSQIGYMVFGLALFTPLAIAGAIFYIFHHIIVKANLFLVGGLVHRVGGTFDLKRLGGLYRRAPLLAFLFFVPAMSLGGIPPLSGFFAKFAVVKAAFSGGSGLGGWPVVVGAIALGVGLLTLFSMTKIWAEAFWKIPPEGRPPGALKGREAALMFGPVAALAAITLAIGIMPEFFFGFAERAAGQLLDPAAYIAAVLGGGR